jgi:HSP20 family protein
MTKKIIPVSSLVRLEYKIRKIENRSIFRPAERPALGEGFFASIDVLEKEAEIVVEMEMPGVLPEDVVILVQHNRLEVRGLKKKEHLPEGGTYLRVEREYGPIRRIVDLPTSVDPDTAKATLQDGILVICLRKPEG